MKKNILEKSYEKYENVLSFKNDFDKFIDFVSSEETTHSLKQEKLFKRFVIIADLYNNYFKKINDNTLNVLYKNL